MTGIVFRELMENKFKMAQGRMLKKAITTSERINKLSDKHALLYSWLI